VKFAFASAALPAAIVLVLLLKPALAVTSHDETDCTGGTGPCIAAVNSPGGVGLQGVSNGGSAGAGVSGIRSGSGGSAVQAINGGGVGLFAQGNPAIEARASGNALTLLYRGLGSDGLPVFRVDSKGTAVFKGKVIGAHESVQITSTGQAVTTFGSASTTPTIEDFGEISLAGGRGYVRFDGRFASVMQGTRYLVFVTP
jgi:hypothetical protein